MDYKKVKKFIPKEYKEEFEMFIQSWLMKAYKKFERVHNLNFMESLDEINYKDNTELRAYLEERLTTVNDLNITYRKPDYETLEEAVEYCKRTLTFLEKINKKYYYELGKALYFIKENYESKREFIKDMEETLERKSAIIFKYISFYKICDEIDGVINCRLTFKEIVNNVKLIREIYNQL